MDTVATRFFITPSLGLGYTVSKVVDRGVIEITGPYGLSSLLPSIGRSIAMYDTGIITAYALYMVLGVLSLVLAIYAPAILYGGSMYNPSADVGVFVVYLVVLCLQPRTGTV